MASADDWVEQQLQAGLAHHENGRLAEAEAIYRRILEQSPDDVEALNLLGVILQDTGDVAQSIALLSKATTIDPEFADAFVNLARAEAAAGRPADAKRDSEKAIALDPDLGPAYLQLSRALLALNENQGAADAAARCVALMPALPDAHHFLGLAKSRLGDRAGAIAAYRDARRLAPDHYETALNLALLLIECGPHDEAAEVCSQVVALRPGDAASYQMLALARRQADDLVGAAAALDGAIRLAPQRPELWNQQGDHYRYLGDFDHASDRYRRALALAPDSTTSLAGLVKINRVSDRQAAKAQFATTLANASRDDDERVLAGFSLGALLDQDADFTAAFAAYDQANRLAVQLFRSRGIVFDATRFRRFIDTLIAGFTPRTFETTHGWGDPSGDLVFIVGMPRSGTTLIEQILASHPRLGGGGETRFVAETVERIGSVAGMAQWEKATIRHEAVALADRLRAGREGDRFTTSKTPDNVLALGYIATLFPNARVIFARRDTRDTCLSCYFQHFGDEMPWAYDLADCAVRAMEIDRLCAHWHEVLPLRMMDVDYERLIQDMDTERERLFNFLGLNSSEASAAFHRVKRVVRSASFWQVRQPLYASSVGRWQQYQSHIGPLLAALSDSRLVVGGTPVGRANGGGPDPLNLVQRLETALQHDDKGAAAVALLCEAAAVSPGQLARFGGLVRSCGLMAQPDRLKAALEQALAATAGNPAAWFLLGVVRDSLGDALGARQATTEALKLCPRDVGILVLHGTLCLKLSDNAAAIEAFRDSLALAPDNVESLTKLGWVLTETGEHGQAVPHLQRAVRLAPDDPRGHLALVMALWRARLVDAAEAACVAALRTAPNLAELWLHLAYCQAARGKFADAAEHYRKSLALNPDLQEARLGLAATGQVDEVQSQRPYLRQILNDDRIEIRERTAAGYALGRSLDQSGDYDEAFAAFSAANRLLLQAAADKGLAFDAAQFDRHVTAIIRVFAQPSAWDVPARETASRAELPVFIVGMPRSGTTLVEQIASSHSKVVGADELDDLMAIAARLEAGTPYAPPASWDPDVVHRAAAAYIAKLRRIGPDADRVIDKMPDNIQLLGHIAVLFPAARIVICRRDLRDVCLSCYVQHFGDFAPWSNDLTQLAARARSTERLIRHWRNVLPNPLLEIRYETLVGDLEGESRRLIEFLGLDWEPACLDFHKTERTVLTASQWQVRQPLYTRSVGRWRAYRKHLGPLLDGLAGLVPPDDGA